MTFYLFYSYISILVFSLVYDIVYTLNNDGGFFMKFLLKIVTICAILLNLTACSSMKTLDAPIPIKIENQTIVVGETQMKALYSCSYLSHLDFEQPLVQNSYYTGIKLYNKKRKVIGRIRPLCRKR